MADEPFDYIGLPFNDTASVNTLVTEMNDTSGRWSHARQLYGHACIRQRSARCQNW